MRRADLQALPAARLYVPLCPWGRAKRVYLLLISRAKGKIGLVSKMILARVSMYLICFKRLMKAERLHAYLEIVTYNIGISKNLINNTNSELGT